MNKLFQITWRWLKRDKKRTALTFWSIVLAVYLISFVGVYLSTALSSYRESVKYENPYHARLFLQNVEQAKTLDKNAAWEAHCLHSYKFEFMANEFMNNYGDSDESYFPIMEINGISFLGHNLLGAALIDGDVEETLGSVNITGRLPQQAHEVAISPELAAKHGGLKVGDTLTLRIGGQKGTLYYAEAEELENLYPPEEIIRDEEGNFLYIEHSEYDENGNLLYTETEYTPHPEPKRDDNGNVIYIEDTDGSKLKEVYDNILSYFSYDTEIYELYMDPEMEDGFRESFHTYGAYGAEIELPPGYAVLSDEKDIILEYTATVTGIVGDEYGDPYVIQFSPEDTEILPYFKEASINYYVRVKPGIDVDEVVGKALDGIGIIDDPEDITDDERYVLNTELLVLEGRQLEYISDLGPLIIIAVIIMFMFVFLARLIINNAFEISAMYRTEQYGSLKTVGASNKQLFVMVMFECALYMLTALPIGFLGAVATGRLVIGKIREIGVFDPIYGEGVSDRFFSLDLSPVVMIITFCCAAFSIFFSAYADAMRVRRMQPIRSVGYGGMKRVKNRRSFWFSRKFGYPTGYAIKCISKEKVRFTVTLLAAVMSGIFIMAFAGVASIYSGNHTDFVKVVPDINVYDVNFNDAERLEAMKNAVTELSASDNFKDVFFQANCYIRNDLSSGTYQNYTNEYIKLNTKERRMLYSGEMTGGMQISVITRELYDKYITADLTYDEFVANGGVLVGKSVGAVYYGDGSIEKYWEDQDIPADISVKESYEMTDGFCCDALDIQVFKNEDIDELVFSGTYYAKDGNGTFKHTERVKVAGLYETDNPLFMVTSTAFHAIVPIENFSVDMFEWQKEAREQIEVRGISLFVNDGCIDPARTELGMVISGMDSAFIEDDFDENTVSRNLLDMVKIAGFGFAFSLAAVVLLNIFSTASANMINRRRDLNMMRSCGMSLKQVRQSMFAEARIYAVITTAVASVVGWIVAVLIYDVIFVVSGDPLIDLVYAHMKQFPWQASILVFAVIMLVMSAAIVPALISMRKQNIAEEMRTDL